jgi:hypothetical protein
MKPITLALVGMVAWSFSGDAPRTQDSKPAAPQAAKADVESVDALVKALYDSISGGAGQARNWDRVRSLFGPKARLIMVTPKRSLVMTPEEYVERAGPNMEKNGFFERQIHARTEEFGDVAHVFSTYESRHLAEDEKPFARGVNSIQLIREKDRWWVTSIAWCEENPTRPIPKEYLPK